MIDGNEIRTNWIIFTVIVFLTVAGGKCNGQVQNTADNCTLATLEQLGEYQIITAELDYQYFMSFK